MTKHSQIWLLGFVMKPSTAVLRRSWMRTFPLLVYPNPRILIVGCGGSGNNTLNRITHLGVEGAVTVAINTDKQHLDNTRSLQKLLVGRHITRGLGAGGDPSMGRRCAEAGREMIRRIVNGADLVFIASGLGGGSGTGICPIVAEEAKSAGALVVGIVTTPFHVERRLRMKKALEGLESLRRVADAVLVLDNNRLLHYVPKPPSRRSLLHHGPIGRRDCQGNC